MFDVIKEDSSRYLTQLKKEKTGFAIFKSCFSPRLLPVIIYRASVWLSKIGLSPASKLLTILNLVLFGIEFPSRVHSGGGLFFPHTSGTVIGAKSLGKNVTIFQGVTLGAKELDMGFNVSLRPCIGDDVIIGAGAKVLGGVIIGDGAIIAANSVVISNVSSGDVVAGAPATSVKK